MSPLTVRFNRSLRGELEAAMVSEDRLADAIRNEERIPLPGEPGLVMCNLIVPVPRVSDPETAELRRISVTMSSHDTDTVEVVRLDGLLDR